MEVGDVEKVGVGDKGDCDGEGCSANAPQPATNGIRRRIGSFRKRVGSVVRFDKEASMGY